MNSALHYRLPGYGLGQCGPGAAATIRSGLLTATSVDPDPTGISQGIMAVGALIAGFFGHPDCNKIATTQIVNKAEVFLTQNLNAWQSLPANQKTLGNQQVALANFDAVWNQVVQACGSGQYGSAGVACLADRQQGGCHYQVNGKCWNWFVGYRDPIANDPQVQINAAATSLLPGSVTGALTSAGISPTMLLIGGGLLLLLVVGMSS